MKKSTLFTLFVATLVLGSQTVCGDDVSTPQKSASSKKSFESFTGRVSRNKVRLRTQPSVDAQVIKELNKNDLVVILGETDDFYTIQPAKETKGYVFRTYVLDNVVEGNHVNVRLRPDLDAPVIAQLNSGDRIEGKIDGANPKWLEIAAPNSTRFYIAKEFIEKAGDANLLSRIEKRREEAEKLVNSTYSLSEAEMQKPFNQVKIDEYVHNYQRAIKEYADFPEIANRANALLASLQENYKNKKIDYLESQSKDSSHELEAKNRTLQDKVAHLESKLGGNVLTSGATNQPTTMTDWIPFEQSLFTNWAHDNMSSDIEDYYKAQKDTSFTLKGVIEPYNRSVKNKPGNYMLVNTHSKLPIAFLYSTKVNLQNYMGHEVSILVTPRPNNNYAFPAYFVLDLE